MNFKDFNEQVQNQFTKMCKTGKLFKSDITGQQVWELYLSSFLPEDNVTFRDPKSSEHNCNCCKNFLRRYGNIVSINEKGELESIFTGITDVEEYSNSSIKVNQLLISSSIKDVFFETYEELDRNLNYEKVNKNQDFFQLGVKSNLKKYTLEEVAKFEMVSPDKTYLFEHFNIKLPKKFVDFSGRSVESIMADYRTKKEVFYKGMKNIPIDTLLLLKDLFNQGSFLNGTSYMHSLDFLIEAKKKFDLFLVELQNSWCWDYTYLLSEEKAKVVNHQIGKSLLDLAEGKDINIVWKEWNRMEDPSNKHKPTAPITQKQIKEAQKFVEENDYVESFNRRLATIEDIKVSEIKHINSGDSLTKSVSIFDNVKPTSTRGKKAEFDKIEEVSIEKFMKDILPSCTSVEAYLENKMVGNLVTMTTTNAAYESKNIFKWSNNYSWTFNGNLAGKSQLREAVKERGGDVGGVLNVRLAFPETTHDYDLHIIEPSGNKIYYTSRRERHNSSGMLDLDAQGCDGQFPPEKRVENINYTDLSKMPEGNYKIFVHNCSSRKFPAGFLIEIETPEGLTTLNFKDLTKAYNGDAQVAVISLKNGEFTITPDTSMILGEGTTVSREVWGLSTNNFHKINLVCLSPNHWGENKVGNLHYLFMLDKCKPGTAIRGFHNENLIADLLKHRKVMEVLGSTALIEPVLDDSHGSLAGIGFNSTVRGELVVRCKGSFNRMLKIKF